MADVEDVITLLERWRDASGLQRVRVGVDAARTIGSLPAARKRTLAVEVARRVAPQLVPAIESESGDLTTEQVSAVIDLLRRADREQLDELVAALRDGDVLEALEIVDDAVTIIDPAASVAAETMAAPAPPAGPTTDAAPAAAAAAAVAGPTDAPDAPPAEPAPPPAPIPVDPFAQRRPRPVVDEAAVRAEAEAAAAARAERWRDDSAATSHEPAYRAPAMDFGIDAELELPDTTVEVLPPLEDRLDSLPGAMPRTTAGAAAGSSTATAAEESAEPGSDTASDGVAAAIIATPDGYRRRRAAVAALIAGTLDDRELLRVVRSLDRSSDRAWVLGAARDAGVLTPSALADAVRANLLSVTAAARLTRRSA